LALDLHRSTFTLSYLVKRHMLCLANDADPTFCLLYNSNCVPMRFVNFSCRDYRPPIPPPSGPSVPPLKWFSAPCQTDLRTKASDRSNSTSWSFHVSVGSLCRNMMISCGRPKRHISTELRFRRPRLGWTDLEIHLL
jgi:hypothetical protein